MQRNRMENRRKTSRTTRSRLKFVSFSSMSHGNQDIYERLREIEAHKAESRAAAILSVSSFFFCVLAVKWIFFRVCSLMQVKCAQSPLRNILEDGACASASLALSLWLQVRPQSVFVFDFWNLFQNFWFLTNLPTILTSRWSFFFLKKGFFLRIFFSGLLFGWSTISLRTRRLCFLFRTMNPCWTNVLTGLWGQGIELFETQARFQYHPLFQSQAAPLSRKLCHVSGLVEETIWNARSFLCRRCENRTTLRRSKSSTLRMWRSKRIEKQLKRTLGESWEPEKNQVSGFILMAEYLLWNSERYGEDSERTSWNCHGREGWEENFKK